ncbi:MAG: protein kinase domain-containing protein [Myxococcota bacterium]
MLADGKKLEARGRLAEALDAYVAQRAWEDAIRLAVSLERHADAARYCLEAGRPYDAAVCFQRAGQMKDCLGALMRVPATSPRYRAACVQAVRVALVVNAPLESLSSFFIPFIGQAPTAPVEAEALKALADTFSEMGKERLALSIYRTVVAAFPHDDEARERLESLEARVAALGATSQSKSGLPAVQVPGDAGPRTPSAGIAQTSPPGSRPSGITSASGGRPARVRLAELVVSHGLVSPQQVGKLLREQPDLGSSDTALAEALVTANLTKDVDLLKLQGEHWGLGWLSDPDAVAAVQPEAARALSQEQAERFHVAPLRIVERHLHVAMENPRDMELIDKLRFATGMVITPFFATEAGIRRARARLYTGEDPGAVEVPSWQGQLFSSDSELVVSPFSDRVTSTREHTFDTGEFNQQELERDASTAARPAVEPSPPRASAPRPVTTGMKIAERYRLEALLGEGGSASVYRARDLELDEPVALKLFHPMSQRDAETLVARFKLELSLSRILTHPNIVRLFDLGVWEGQRYLTMEYLEGKDLGSRLEQLQGPLPVGAVVSVLEQACEALAAAHERGIVHRDIKPANLFVTDEGVVKVMDFGIARRLDTPGVTVTGTIAGTPEYMSPEQINSFSESQGPADMYSLGATAYHLLTGSLPFPYRELMKVLLAQATEQPAPLRAKNPAVPPELEALVLALLAKDPARRPTARQAADALRRLGSV